MATPLPSGWARPGVTAMPGVPSSVPRSWTRSDEAVASLPARLVRGRMGTGLEVLPGQRGVDGLSAAKPMTAASASSTAPR